MKIEVLQEQLMKGLELVSRAIAARVQLPVLSNCLLEATSEGLILSATDLEIGIRCKVAAKVIEAGKVTVPAKMLLEFLATVAPGKVELQLDKETLVLSAGAYKARLQTMSADEFPQLPELGKETMLGKLETKELGAAAGRVIFASARDSLRPVLTGVLWEIEKNKIKLVATDGFRLGVEELKFAGGDTKATLLVPARVVAEVVRLGGEGEVSIGHLPNTNQVYFETGEIMLVSQLLEGNFPDYNKILPKDFGSEIVIAKDELLQAVRAAHIFARDNSNMVKWEVGENKLTLTATSPERGECRVEVPIKLVGETGEIIFNAKYVLDYLGVVTGEEIWLGMSGKLAPGMLRDVGNKNGVYVVMPINA